MGFSCLTEAELVEQGKESVVRKQWREPVRGSRRLNLGCRWRRCSPVGQESTFSLRENRPRGKSQGYSKLVSREAGEACVQP